MQGTLISSESGFADYQSTGLSFRDVLEVITKLGIKKRKKHYSLTILLCHL